MALAWKNSIVWYIHIVEQVTSHSMDVTLLANRPRGVTPAAIMTGSGPAINNFQTHRCPYLCNIIRYRDPVFTWLWLHVDFTSSPQAVIHDYIVQYNGKKSHPSSPLQNTHSKPLLGRGTDVWMGWRG